MDVFHCLTRLRTRKIIWGIGIIGSITLSPGWSGQPPITPQQQQQQQQQQQRSDPSSARAFAFLIPLRIALKRVLSLTAGSVLFMSVHAAFVL